MTGVQMGRVSVAFNDGEEFAAVRAAFVADYENVGAHDTLRGWVAAAIEEHAARSVAQRRAWLDQRERSPGSTIRSYRIPATTLDRCAAAMAADRRAGVVVSVSSWVATALAAATGAARERNGGSLPVVSSRLPNRLVGGSR